MASHVFSVLGDSNVKRFVTLTNRRACPDLDKAQVLLCGKQPLLQTCLEEVSAQTTICILACLTNFVTSSPGQTSAALRVEPVLLDVLELLRVTCAENPDRTYLLCPPMYRTFPLWYRDGLSEILGKFSTVFLDRPANLMLMPSFPSPQFDSDGVHLTPTSGLDYLFYLFDSAKEVVRLSSLEPAQRTPLSSEATRVLEDRMMAIEQDHKRLNKNFEMSIAVQAEREDFQENVRNEVYFMISGLTMIKDLRGKEWMDRAISDVQEVIRLLLNKELPIVVVHNATGRGQDAEVRYSVRMEYAADSQEIRKKFGMFFVGGQDRRPEGLKKISISNKVTPGTQIRVMILKLLGRRYLASNKEAKVKVIGYESRPMLKITPAGDDRRVKNFTFIDAISKLPTHFTTSEMRPIISKARVHFRGKIRSTFVVLSDDAPSIDATDATDAADGADDEIVPEPGVDVPAVVRHGRKRANPDAAHPRAGSQRARL